MTETKYIYLCDGMRKKCRNAPSCAINSPGIGTCDHTAELRHAKNAVRILNGQAKFEEEQVSKDRKVYWEVDYLQ